MLFRWDGMLLPKESTKTSQRMKSGKDVGPDGRPVCEVSRRAGGTVRC